jgi:hypothetical protein
MNCCSSMIAISSTFSAKSTSLALKISVTIQSIFVALSSADAPPTPKRQARNNQSLRSALMGWQKPPSELLSSKSRIQIIFRQQLSVPETALGSHSLYCTSGSQGRFLKIHPSVRACPDTINNCTGGPLHTAWQLGGTS